MKTMKFIPKKIKLRPGGGLQVEYSINDRGQTMDGLTRNSPDVVHPDMIAAFEKLKVALIHTHHLNWGVIAIADNLMIKDVEKNAIEKMRHLIDDAYRAIVDLVSVSGFTVSGEGAQEAVVVTGTLESKGKKIGIASARIVLESDVFGIEEDLKLNVVRAINEVHDYLFKGKVGEQTGNLFAPHGEQTDSNEDNGVDPDELGEQKPQPSDGKKVAPKKAAPKKAASKKAAKK